MTVSPCGRMQEGNHPGLEGRQHCLLHLLQSGGVGKSWGEGGREENTVSQSVQSVVRERCDSGLGELTR